MLMQGLQCKALDLLRRMLYVLGGRLFSPLVSYKLWALSCVAADISN
jgi:hypothetical protein